MTRTTLAGLQAAASRPAAAAAQHALGLALLERREFDEAIGPLSRAAELDPTAVAYTSDLARAWCWAGSDENGARALRAAVALAPARVDLRLRLGHTLERMGDVEGARAAFAEAVRVAPGDVEARSQVCRLLLDDRSRRAAVAGARAVAADIPGDGDRVMAAAMAAALHWHGAYEEASAWWADALRPGTADVRVLVGAAECALALGDAATAEQRYDEALALRPDDVFALHGRFCHAVRRGRLDLARAAIVRFMTSTHEGQPSQPAAAPPWTGEEDLHGRTVLVECEGAFGDQLQFGRLAADIGARGACVILQCLPRLRGVMASMPGVDAVISAYDDCPPFDYQCRADVAGFLTEWRGQLGPAAKAYLSADGARRAHWRRRFAGRRRIGVVWRAQALSVTSTLPPHKQPRNAYAYRSAPVDVFRRLADLPDTSVVSLQVGAGEEEITASTRAWLTDGVGSECSGFEDSAAAVSALDLVVTIDSAMVHLTGGLGVPSCLMLPYYPEFRWFSAGARFEQGERSPWYPSVRVFRQPRPGDWASAIEAIADTVTAAARLA